MVIPAGMLWLSSVAAADFASFIDISIPLCYIYFVKYFLLL